MKNKKVILGKCPYCKSNNYRRMFSEMVTEMPRDYNVYDCECMDCGKGFTEYFSIDEVKFDDENGEECYASFGKGQSETDKREIEVEVYQ